MRSARALGSVVSALMLLHPTAVFAASRTSAFTAASPQGTFQNPASTNHFSTLRGRGGACSTCSGGGGSCSSCSGGGAGSGCPSCPNGGGLAAGDCPTCGRGSALKVAGCTKCGEPEGLLVHSGEFFYTRTDLVVPGVGLDFRMCRIYRSGIAYDGPLGKKWEFCHNVRLTELGNENVKWIGMGREDTFTKSGSTYTNPTGWFGTLTKQTTPSVEFKFVEPQGLTWRFEDDGGGGWFRLKEKKDRNGNRLEYAYDGSSRLTAVKDTLDRVHTFSYDGNGRIVTATDHGSRSVVYTYDGSGRLVSARTPTVDAEGTEDDYPSGKTIAYGYDSNDRLTSIKNPGETSPYVSNGYDTGGKLTSQQAGPTGYDYSVTYDGTGKKTTVTDREGNKAVYRYDGSDRVTKVDLYGGTIGVGGNSYTFAYGSADLITKVTLPRGNLVEYSFDSNGNLLTSKRKKDAADGGLVTILTFTTDYNQISTVTDPEGRVTDYDHDASGNVTKITLPTVTSPSGISTTDKNGNSRSDGSIKWDYTYTANGQVKTVTDPRGTQITYSFSLVNSITAYRTKEAIDPSGLNLARDYAYDTFGNVTSVTDGEGKTTTYVVNELNQVLKVTAPSPLSYVTKFHYDIRDNLTKVEVENDTEVGNSWFITDYEYDFLNNLTRTIQDVDSSSRITTKYDYDKSERLTKVTKPSLNEVVTVYDERDLVVTRTRKAASSSDDSSQVFEYDGNVNLTKQKDGVGNATTHAFDLYDRRTTTTFALSHYVVSAYDKNSNVTKVSRYNSGSTLLAETTSYLDELNRLWKTEELAKKSDGNNIGSDGKRTTTFWRDELGAVLESTDEGGHVWANVYDGAGRLVTAKDALSGSSQNKTIYAYDKRSLVTSQSSDERSQDTGIEPDRVIDTTFTYDALGRLITRTDENGSTEIRTWNKRGLVKQIVDENSKKGLWRYDELGRVLTAVQVLVDDASFTNDVVVEYVYDSNSRVVTLRAWHSAGNQNTVFTYDNLDRVVTKKYPDTFLHVFTYDKADNVVTSVDPNGTQVVNSYDAQNRLTQAAITRATGVEGPTKETFAYDGLNRLTNAYNEIKPDQTIEFKTEVKFVYNTLSLVEKETLVIDGYNSGNGRDTSYTYDEEGRVVTLTYPDGTTVTYAFDSDDRIDSISRGSTTVCDYAFAGPSRSIKKDKPGTLSTYKYDALGRVTEILHKKDSNGNSLFKVVYGYDSTINPIYADLHNYDNSNTRFTSGSDDEGQQYYYDNAYRLTKAYRDVPTSQIATRPPTSYGTKLEYVYDDTGNRTTKKVNDEVDTTYSYDAVNALTTAGSQTLGYDKNGNVVDHGSAERLYWYDYQNRRVRINNGGDTPETISRYDALGRRVQKEDSGTGTTKRYYFSGWQALHEVGWASSTETITHRWVYGPWIDEPLEYTDIAANPDKFYYYHEDRLSSIRAITDDQGVIKETYRYSEWGETEAYDGSFSTITDPAVSPVGNRFAFTASQLEEDTAEGAYYVRARHLDTGYGRFLQRDRIAYGGSPIGANPYVYVGNSPATQVDPLGLQGQSPWCDSVPTFLEQIAQRIKWWNDEEYWCQRHCKNHCRMSALFGPEIAKALGELWEWFEHEVLYGKLLNRLPFKLFPPLDPEERRHDLEYCNPKGIECWELGNSTAEECWCCCCRLLSKKDPCAAPGTGGPAPGPSGPGTPGPGTPGPSQPGTPTPGPTGPATPPTGGPQGRKPKSATTAPAGLPAPTPQPVPAPAPEQPTTPLIIYWWWLLWW